MARVCSLGDIRTHSSPGQECRAAAIASCRVTAIVSYPSARQTPRRPGIGMSCAAAVGAQQSANVVAAFLRQGGAVVQSESCTNDNATVCCDHDTVWSASPRGRRYCPRLPVHQNRLADTTIAQCTRPICFGRCVRRACRRRWLACFRSDRPYMNPRPASQLLGSFAPANSRRSRSTSSRSSAISCGVVSGAGLELPLSPGR